MTHNAYKNLSIGTELIEMLEIAKYIKAYVQKVKEKFAKKKKPNWTSRDQNYNDENKNVQDRNNGRLYIAEWNTSKRNYQQLNT